MKKVELNSTIAMVWIEVRAPTDMLHASTGDTVTLDTGVHKEQ